VLGDRLSQVVGGARVELVQAAAVDDEHVPPTDLVVDDDRVGVAVPRLAGVGRATRDITASRHRHRHGGHDESDASVVPDFLASRPRTWNRSHRSQSPSRSS
jgi:hypothetical protein